MSTRDVVIMLVIMVAMMVLTIYLIRNHRERCEALFRKLLVR